MNLQDAKSMKTEIGGNEDTSAMASTACTTKSSRSPITLHFATKFWTEEAAFPATSSPCPTESARSQF